MRKRKQIKKQKTILAFIMLLILLISGVGVSFVFSADSVVPTALYVGSTQVVSNGTVTGNTSGDGWRYESETNTLYLDGANIKGQTVDPYTQSTVDNIFAYGDLNINFTGDNYLTSQGNSGYGMEGGIYTRGNLTLSGDGTLNIICEKTSNNTALFGIYPRGDLNILSGTININTGDTVVGEASYGIYLGGLSPQGNFSISGNAKLDITTGYGGDSYGINQINTSANFNVSENAIVTVKTSEGNSLTKGICGGYITVSDNAKIDAQAKNAGVSSYGIDAKSLTVSGNAQLYGESGTASDYTYGIGSSTSENFAISGNAEVTGKTNDTQCTDRAGIAFKNVIANDGYYWQDSENGAIKKSSNEEYTYTRGIYSEYVKFIGHTHEFDGTNYDYDDDVHWQLCGTEDCPNPSNGISEVKEEHEYSKDDGECVCGDSIPFTIITQPKNQTVEYAYTEQPELSVKVNDFGKETISYQWYENGESIPGANSSTYKIPTGKNLGSNTYYCIVSASNYSETSDEATVTIEQRDISNGTIKVIGEYSYTGNEITPQYNVTVDGISLNNNTDYTIAYTKDGNAATPVNAGTYTVTVTGVNGYKGTLTGSLEIEKAKPDLGQISYSGTVTDQSIPSDVTLTRVNTSVPGTLILDESNTIQANVTEYTWTFTPENTANYEIVTGKVNIDVKDTISPTAAIKIRNIMWDKFTANPVSHDVFSKNPIEVVITAKDNDTGSGLSKVEYIISKGSYVSSVDSLTGDWTTLTEGNGEYTFEINENMVAWLYVRVIDNDNNSIVINTTGIVKYEEVSATTKSIEYTKTSTEDVNVEIDLKGNKIKEIKYGANTLTEDVEYTLLSDNGFVFDADYLNSFAAGSGYKFTISYRPMRCYNK